jgi:hypothetical protein
LLINALGLAAAIAFLAFAVPGRAPAQVHAALPACELMKTTLVVPPGSYCIQIINQTSPSSNQAFEFYVEEPAPTLGVDFELKDGESASIDVFAPGEYVITEEVPDGWRLVDIDCDAVDFDVDIDVDDASVSLTTTSGNESLFTATCTFYNERRDDDEDEDDEGGHFIGGGIFGQLDTASQNRARAQANANAAAAATAAAAPRTETIRPPSTGDGGLLP